MTEVFRHSAIVWIWQKVQQSQMATFIYMIHLVFDETKFTIVLVVKFGATENLSLQYTQYINGRAGQVQQTWVSM